MEPESDPKKGLSPIFAIFITVFIDLLSFGVFIPDLQLRGRKLAIEALGSANHPQLGLLIGISIASFSLAQLLTATRLGALSDQIGRRKVLLATAVLNVLSYVVYAHADNLPTMILARVLNGIAAANLGVAFAYIADISKPEERAKSLGLIGAAFGMGFILGPALGSLLLLVNHDSPLILGYVGAAFCCVNVFFIWKYLPESLKTMSTSARKGTITLLSEAFKMPGLNLLLAMFFVLQLGFTNLESTFFQLLAAKNWIHHLPDDRVKIAGAFILIWVGIIGASMQGKVIGIVAPKFGEVKLLRFAFLVYVPAFFFVPYVPLWLPMLTGCLFLGIASGIAQPSLSSLISRTAPGEIQGSVFGVTQSLGALARFVGPLMSNPLFQVKPSLPYTVGTALILVPAIASIWIKMPAKVATDEVVIAH